MMEDIGPVRVRKLIKHLGSIEEIFSASSSTLNTVNGIGPKVAESIVSQQEKIDVEEEINRAVKLGVEIITQVDDAYPSALKEIHDPPLVLYVKGTLEEKDKHAIAVVGSRRASHYGQQTADRLSFQLGQCGFTVISGLARGIDAAAHRGALKSKGRTLAVLGSAIDELYPDDHQNLADEISKQGALVSEFKMGTQASKTTFPMRNRIVSGLGMGVLVVEASRQSGAMITVDEATSQGRLVFSVPGRIDSPGSSGCHLLIKNGAVLVEDISDIVEEFEYLTTFEDSQKLPGIPPVELSKEEKKVVELLTAGGLSVDELCRASDIPMAKINALLIGLEMKRILRMLPGRRIELLR